MKARLVASWSPSQRCSAAGCGGEEATGQEGANRSNGKTLFVSGAEGRQSCGSCHTLLDAGTAGTVGPEPRPGVRLQLRPGVRGEHLLSAVLGQIGLAAGAMPPDLVTGQDAVDIAAYVASVAGKDVPGCDPSGDQGDTGTAPTTSG